MQINKLRAGVLLSYSSIIVTITVALLYTPVMLRLMGQAEYGLYALIISLAGYLSILDMGIGNAMVRYTAIQRVIGDKEAEYSLNGMFMAIYSVIGVGTLFIGAVLYWNIENMFGATLSVEDIQRAKIMLALLIINFAISFPLGVFGFIMQAYEKFATIQTITILRSISNPLIMLPLLIFGYGAVAMVVLQVALNLICLLVNLLYCFGVIKIKIHFHGFDFPLLREIAGYSFFVFLTVIMDKIYYNSGQFILGIVSGTLMVAVYAIAMQLNTMYMLFSCSITGVLLPRTTIMVANNASNDELSQMMIKIGRVQYVILAYLLSGFILFGQSFINLWAGSMYADAYYIGLIIMVPITVPLIQNMGVVILQAKNLNSFRAVVYVAIAVVNVVVSIPLAQSWGVFGCAIATGSSLIIGPVIIMNIYYYRNIGLQIPLFWKNIATISFPIVISAFCGHFLNYIFHQDDLLRLAIKICLFSVVYVCLVWFIGLNRYEKELFFSPVKKMLQYIES